MSCQPRRELRTYFITLSNQKERKFSLSSLQNVVALMLSYNGNEIREDAAAAFRCRCCDILLKNNQCSFRVMWRRANFSFLPLLVLLLLILIHLLAVQTPISDAFIYVFLLQFRAARRRRRRRRSAASLHMFFVAVAAEPLL